MVSAHHDVAAAVERAAVVAEAQNAARDLQNTPANDMTPTALAERARELAAEIDGLEVEVHGREWLAEQRMGAFAVRGAGDLRGARAHRAALRGRGATARCWGSSARR